jgi:ribosomal protein L37AE/L43A
MDELFDEAWTNAKADPFGAPFTSALLGALNNNPAEEIISQRYATNLLRRRGVPVPDLPPPDVAALREQQKELRALVDQYLDGGSVVDVVRALREKLDQRPYRIFVGTQEETPGYPQEEGAVAFLRLQLWDLPDHVTYDNWESFARFLTSPLAKRLRRCPQCRTYFIAEQRSNQVFCCQECGWRARGARYRQRDPEAHRARQAEIMRDSRARKKQSAPGKKVAQA